MVARADLNIVLKATDRASPSIKNLQSTIIRFVGAVSAALAGLSAIAFPIKQAAEFERALKNVQKTTGFLNEDIDVLGDALSKLSQDLVVPAKELAEIAAVAGQLGLGREGTKGIIEFTETIAIASAALDIAAETAAVTGARLRNVFQLDLAQVTNLFSTVNELSNTTTANAEGLIDVITRLGATAGLAFQETAALAATAIDVGVSREVAGTSLAKVFTKLQSDSEDFAKALGVEIGEFIGLGAFDRFQLFIKTLAGQSEQLRAENIRTLAGSGRIFVTIDKLVNDAAAGGILLARNITTANESFEAGTSILTEYKIQTDALIPTLSILGNNLTALSKEIGDTLLPTLTRISRELIVFLKSDEAEDFAREVGEAFTSVISSVEAFVRGVIELDINFRNVLATVKLFVALQLGQLFLSLVRGTALWAVQLLLISTRITKITKIFGIFRGLAILSTFTFAGALTKLATLASTLGTLLLRIAGPVGLIIGVGAVVFGVLEASGFKVTELFTKVFEFFGFVSDEQAKLESNERKRIARLKETAEKAAADIRNVEKQIAEKAFDDSEFSVGITLDRDGGLEVFNDGVKVAITGIADLTGALSATRGELERIDDRQALINIKIKEEEKIRKKNAQEILEGRFVLEQSGVIGAASIGILGFQLDKLEEQNDLIRARRGLLEDEFNANLKRTLKLNQQTDLFQKKLEFVAIKIRETFSGEQIGILKLTGQLEEATRRANASTEELGKSRERLRLLNQAGFADTDQAAIGTRAAAEVAKLQTANAAVQAEVRKLNRFLDKELEGAEKTTIALIKNARDFIKNLGDEQLGNLNESIDIAGAKADETTTAFRDLDKTVKIFGLDLAKLEVQKKAIEGIAEAAQEMAATAKGAFDNTSRTIRAFRSDILEAVRSLDTLLVERKFNLRLDTRQDEVTAQINAIETNRADIIAKFDKEITEARLGSEKVYLRRRKEIALEALGTEQAALESNRAFLEEKALTDRIGRLEARTRDFVQAAQFAASQGNVDEALGLSEAARDATKEIGDIIKELALLEEIDPLGGSNFRKTSAQIGALIGDLKDTERSVSREIPGINKKLKDVTGTIADKLTATESSIDTQLAQLNINLAEINKTIPDFTKNVKEFAALAARTVFADANRAAAAGNANSLRSGAQGLAAEGARQDTFKILVDSADTQKRLLIEAQSANKLAQAGQLRTEAIFENTIRGAALARARQTITGRAEGGVISGPGGPKSDSILARLSAGEFVVNAATRKFFGSGFFYDLQAFARKGGKLKLPGFATGGAIGLGSNFEPVIQAAGMGGAPVHIHLPGGDTMRLQEGEDTVNTVKRMMNREARKRGRRLR